MDSLELYHTLCRAIYPILEFQCQHFPCYIQRPTSQGIEILFHPISFGNHILQVDSTSLNLCLQLSTDLPDMLILNETQLQNDERHFIEPTYVHIGDVYRWCHEPCRVYHLNFQHRAASIIQKCFLARWILERGTTHSVRSILFRISMIELLAMVRGHPSKIKLEL